MQVYLPDDLYELVKARGLPASELLQKAVRAELSTSSAPPSHSPAERSSTETCPSGGQLRLGEVGRDVS